MAAWGSAPGRRACESTSAESAIHSSALSLRFGFHERDVWDVRANGSLESRLQRSFTMRSPSWGAAPGWYEPAPLALNTHPVAGTVTPDQ